MLKAYLINTENGVMVGVNSLGVLVTKLYSAGKTKENIINIVKKYEPEITSRSIINFLKELQENNFLPNKTKILPVDKAAPPLLTAQLDLTWECNLQCKHCYLGENKTLIEPPLSFKEWQGVIDQLKQMDVPKIAFLGGEPLLNKFFFKLANYAYRKGFLIYTTTNGTLVTEKIAQKFKEAGFKEVDVSLDGAKAATHEFLRGKNTFFKTIKGIKHLINTGIKIKTSTVIYKKNFSEIKNLIKIGKRLGVDRMYFNALLPGGRAKELSHYFLSVNKWRKIKDFLKKWSQRNKYPLLYGEYYFIFDGINPKDSESCEYAGCKAGKREIIITPDGFVAVCPLLSTERLFQNSNIRRMAIKDIWEKDPWILRLREIDETNIEGKCKKCVYRNVCKGGCHIISLWEKGKPTFPDPRCPYR